MAAFSFGRKGKKPSRPENPVEGAWRDYVAAPDAWSPRDQRAVQQLPQMDPEAATKLQESLGGTVDRALTASEPVVALREAIMDATDRFVLAESMQAEGGSLPADVVESIVEAGVLRRLSKLRFKDCEKDDWYAHYLKVAEMNARNVGAMIRKTVSGEQAAMETSLHDPLTRTMQQVRGALLRHPPRTPVERADELVAASSIRLAPNRQQVDRLTNLMKWRFDKLFSGQVYRMEQGPSPSPSGAFQVDAGLLYAQLSMHFRHPNDSWREIMGEALGPYREAMQNEDELLRIGEKFRQTWIASRQDGPLKAVLVEAHPIAFESAAADATDLSAVVSAMTDDAGVLVGEIRKVIEAS